MEMTKPEKLARLSGKATSKALDALGKSGFDICGKLSAPISRVPRRAPPPKPKPRVMTDPDTIYNWHRLDDRITTRVRFGASLPSLGHLRWLAGARSGVARTICEGGPFGLPARAKNEPGGP